MNQINLQNRLAVSNGTVKNGQINAMQPASQTTESPATAKKRLGLLAVLAVGVDAAASFLKSKMEKAADAVLGAVQIQPPKIAEKRLAKGKARLTSALLLAFLVGIFAAQPQAIAQYLDYGPVLPVGGALPYYDKQIHENMQTVRTIPIFGDIVDSRENWRIYYRFNSEVLSPAWVAEWGISASAFECYFTGNATSMWDAGFTSTTWWQPGGPISTYYWKDKFGQAQSRKSAWSHLEPVSHSQVGRKVTVTSKTTTTTGGISITEERTTEEWKCPFYSSSTGTPRPGDIIAHIATWFVARYEGKTLEDGWDGSCDSFTVKSPGPEVIHTPCRPINMNAPTNSCIIYHLETSFTARTSGYR